MSRAMIEMTTRSSMMVKARRSLAREVGGVWGVEAAHRESAKRRRILDLELGMGAETPLGERNRKG